MFGIVAKSLTTAALSTALAGGVVWFGFAPEAAEAESDHPHRIDAPDAPEKAKPEGRKVESSGERREDSTVDRRAAPTDKDSDTSRIAVREEKRANWKRSETATESDRDAYTTIMEMTGETVEDVEKTVGDLLDEAEELVAELDEIEVDAGAVEVPDLDELQAEIDAEIARAMPDASDEEVETTVEVFVEDGETIVRRTERRTQGGQTTITRTEEVISDAEAREMADKAEATETRRKYAEIPAPVHVEAGDKPRSKSGMGSDMPRVAPSGADGADMASLDLPGPDTPLRTYVKAAPSELLETTETIGDDDLRDQALYAVTTYALRFDEFSTAREAVSRIESTELADTAMSKIAVRHGELGDIGKALDVIEGLENEELRDIIRVRLVETLTTPLEMRERIPGY